LIRNIPDANGDDVTLLLQHFPVLGGDETALEKWWTLGLAHASVRDGHLPLSLSETDRLLTPLLRLTVGTTQYALADYKTYLKNDGASIALAGMVQKIAALSPQAHPILQPVLLEYQRIAVELARNKTSGIDKALENIAAYRELIIERMDKIEDYLNWYEATQMPEQSGAFTDFMQEAKDQGKWKPPQRHDVISKYIDQLEREFE